MLRASAIALFALLLVSASATWQLGAFAPRAVIQAHHGLEYHLRSDVLGGLPDTINALFYGSGKCAGCHGGAAPICPKLAPPA